MTPEVLIRFSALCVGAMILYLVGTKDDLIGVDYKFKFGMQILSGILMAMSGISPDSFGGGEAFRNLIPPALIGPACVFICVYITNSINLIDGIDGLASGLALIAFITMGTLFLIGGEVIYAILSFSATGTLIPFFCINVHKSFSDNSKLFMGDTGSLTLGYLLSFLYLSLCSNTGTFNPTNERFHYIALGALIIPLFDVVRVVLLRLRLRKPPFAPDRNHIHHKLMRAGMTDRSTLITLLIFSVFYILCNYILTDYFYGYIVLIIDIFIWIVFHGILHLYIANHEKKKSTSRTV
ncbi:MAG: MraY family glycosyltransferase [Bacteroidales bacterium]